MRQIDRRSVQQERLPAQSRQGLLLPSEQIFNYLIPCHFHHQYRQTATRPAIAAVVAAQRAIRDPFVLGYQVPEPSTQELLYRPAERAFARYQALQDHQHHHHGCSVDALFFGR